MRIIRFLIILLAIAGTVISVLALRVHNMDVNAAPPCAVSEHWDCGAVNHSRFAVFPPRGFDELPDSKGHIPVAILGIAGYVLIALLALLKRDFLVFEASQVGLFCALLLTFLEKYVLEKWCIYCVYSQIIVLVTFILAAIDLWLAKKQQNRAGLHLRAI